MLRMQVPCERPNPDHTRAPPTHDLHPDFKIRINQPRRTTRTINRICIQASSFGRAHPHHPPSLADRNFGCAVGLPGTPCQLWAQVAVSLCLEPSPSVLVDVRASFSHLANCQTNFILEHDDIASSSEPKRSARTSPCPLNTMRLFTEASLRSVIGPRPDHNDQMPDFTHGVSPANTSSMLREKEKTMPRAFDTPRVTGVRDGCY